jgi:Kef-type K+ transport system membrane component KefB
MMPLLLILLLSGLMHAARSYQAEGSGVNPAQALGYLMLAAFFAGNFVKRLRLPKLTGYLAIGIIAGPPVLNLVSESALERLKLISGMATALIALSAGAEMELRTMRPLIRSVLWISIVAIIGTMLLLSGAVFLFRPFLPFLRELPTVHAAIVSLILGVVMAAQSPAVVMALRTETGAAGPLMSTVLGVVVIGDFLVILIFAVVSTIGQAVFGGKADLAAVTRSLSWELLGSMVAGVCAGVALWIYLKKVKGSGSLFILVVCVIIAEVGHRLHFDPLLVALAAGVFIRNVTSVGNELHNGINASLLPVYVVFFSVAGATIHFAVLATVWAPALVFIVVRALGFLGGARLGAAIADAPPMVRRYAGFGLLPQAGLALALSLLFARTFPQFGAAAGALTLGVVALNEILAPALFRTALLRSGEAQLLTNPTPPVAAPTEVLETAAVSEP